MLEALCDSRIGELTTGYPEFPNMIRLKPDHDSLQKAMDIAGEWFDGFEIPEGVTVYSLSEEAKKMIEVMGAEKAARLTAWRMMESGDIKF